MNEFSVKTDPAFRLAALVRTAGYRARWTPPWPDALAPVPGRVAIWESRLDDEATVVVRFDTDADGSLVKWNDRESRTTEPHDLWAEIRATMSDA